MAFSFFILRNTLWAIICLTILLLKFVIIKILFVHNSSAFFWFCNDERTKVKALNPEYGVGDIAKELGKKWSDVEPSVKSKYEAMADRDKKRYEVVSRINK